MSSLHPCSLRPSQDTPRFALLLMSIRETLFYLLFPFLIRLCYFFPYSSLLFLGGILPLRRYISLLTPSLSVPKIQKKVNKRRHDVIYRQNRQVPLVNKRRERTAIFLDSCKVWPENLMLEVMITQCVEKQCIKVPLPRKFNIHYRFLSQGSVE